MSYHFIAKYSGLGLLTATLIWHIKNGFNYNVLGLYVLGACLFLVWWFNKRKA